MPDLSCLESLCLLFTTSLSIYNFLKAEAQNLPVLKLETREPSYPNTPPHKPEDLILLFTFTPGKRRKHVQKIKAKGLELSLTGVPGLVKEHYLREFQDLNQTGNAFSSDSLKVDWSIPASADCPEQLTAAVCVRFPNSSLKRRILERVHKAESKRILPLTRTISISITPEH